MSLLWRQESWRIDEIPVCTGMTRKKEIPAFESDQYAVIQSRRRRIHIT
ncbi:MAG: hypothetical protein N2319_01710 [Candidatus Kapabacteria bacterium]|nr:hypothetical protein [Candidatus Kapabacteria bacterium]